MTVPFAKSSFSSGEISPSLYGRFDLSKWHSGASTARNCYVSYKGGLASRGGTAFVGASKQPGSAAPPRLIRFKFNIFQSYILEFGEKYVRFIATGGYVLEVPFAISAATQANPAVLTAVGHNFVVGDYVFLAAIGGMVQLNGRTFIVSSVAGNTFTLNDVFGNPINSLGYGAYTSGGTAGRVYTLATPYAAVDLPYLKFTQSADVMSLCCVNQQTHVDYPPQDLTRLTANHWTLTPTTFASSIGAPTGVTATPSVTTGTNPCAYSYVVTAIDDATGDESIASNIGTGINSVDISITFGTITVNWTPPALNPGQTIGQFNIYKATPSFTNGAQTGQLFGFVGTTLGNATVWQDTNIIPDFAVTPPLHNNPFPGTGNYPGVVSYFQQRRTYADTLNEPDTLFLSQPGSFTNFDSADPPIDSDAITTTPWSLQVNGIQWLTPMPGGLVALTGEDAWQLSGTAGAGSPITPAQQSAAQQESNGSSPFLQPIKINYDILYGQALGSIVRDLQYNLFYNIYAGTDVTILSSHLFSGRTLLQWAWAREPNKVIWAVRDDGQMLSLTFLKEQELSGWTRHDTNGLFVSVATASEPPVDAIYVVVQRFIRGPNKWMYYVERMDNRIWANVEQCWCVDCGLNLPQPAPNATLNASTATLLGGITNPIVIQGGSNYTAPAGAVIDLGGTGSGAMVGPIPVAGGVITGAPAILTEGKGYTSPQLVITDSTGAGGQIALNLDNPVTFTASAGVFDGVNTGVVGQVVRMGGGIAAVTAFVSPTQVQGQLSVPIATVIKDDPTNTPVPATAGNWSITTPVSTVFGLDHLEGMQISILADGSVAPNATVVNGSIALPAPASQVTIGLPFIAQAQSLHAEIPGAMIQGKRKRIPGVTVRLANSRGVAVGQDQPIAAVQPNQGEIPWGQSPYGRLTEIAERSNLITAGNAEPLFTGDRYYVIESDFQTPDKQASPGMIAVQQSYCLPLELLALVPDVDIGDMPDDH
jgi:hypothetical protein